MTSMTKKKRSAHPVDIHVGKVIREMRHKCKFSQDEIAKAVDLTFQQIQKYEKGTNRVSCGKLWEFSKLFDVPISYFFKGIMVDESEYMYLSRLDSSEFAADEKKKTHMRDAKLNAQIVEQVERIKDANLKESILSFIRSFTRQLEE